MVTSLLNSRKAQHCHEHSIFWSYHICITFFCLCLSPSRLMENATDTFFYLVEGLSPYTPYAFRVVVSHTHGQTVSPWENLLTAEDSKYTYSHTQLHTLHLHGPGQCKNKKIEKRRNVPLVVINGQINTYQTELCRLFV